MAIIDNMINRNRINLGEAIPLQTPFVIQLEASGCCNLECTFCPIGEKKVPKKYSKIMSLETFETFLNQCKDFPNKIKVLRIIGMGEPLLNKNISEFVRRAKKSKLFERIEITSNGVLLNQELSLSLVDAGLDVLLISLSSTDEGKFFELTKRKINLTNFKNQLRYFYENRKNTKLYIKTTNLGIERKEDFYKEYGEFCDYIYVENVIENWPEFSVGVGKDAVRYDIAEYQEKKKICIQPFKLLCLAANGDVMPCCVDWKRALYLGNIFDNNLFDIWNGDKRNKLLCSLLAFKPCSFCSVCGYPSQNQPDNIDEYRQEILKKIKI